jgi:hypothetical protein
MMKHMMINLLEVQNHLLIFMQDVTLLFFEPTRYDEGTKDSKWIEEIKEELRMIEKKKNQTWILVDKPSHKNLIGIKCVYRIKLNLDGSVNKHK